MELQSVLREIGYEKHVAHTKSDSKISNTTPSPESSTTSRSPPQPDWRALPTETWIQIFRYLDFVSVCKCAQVCKYLLPISNDSHLWKRLCLLHNVPSVLDEDEKAFFTHLQNTPVDVPVLSTHSSSSNIDINEEEHALIFGPMDSIESLELLKVPDVVQPVIVNWKLRFALYRKRTRQSLSPSFWYILVKLRVK
jgi:hypothetical protein